MEDGNVPIPCYLFQASASVNITLEASIVNDVPVVTMATLWQVLPMTVSPVLVLIRVPAISSRTPQSFVSNAPKDMPVSHLTKEEFYSFKRIYTFRTYFRIENRIACLQ